MEGEIPQAEAELEHWQRNHRQQQRLERPLRAGPASGRSERFQCLDRLSILALLPRNLDGSNPPMARIAGRCGCDSSLAGGRTACIAGL